MSVVLLIVFIVISILVTRVGAVALEMTGLQKEKARFQALSAFLRAGFATRDSELVVNHPQRRRIVTTLMILGNGGIICIIATLVLSLRPGGLVHPSVNLLIIVAAVYILYRITTYERFANGLTAKIREKLATEIGLEKASVEEVFHQAEGYGIAVVEITEDSEIIGLPLSQSGFKERNITVLSIERGEQILPIPKGWNKIRAGDRLVCYGKLETIAEIV